MISFQELWLLFKSLWMCPPSSSETAKGAFPGSRAKPLHWRIQTFPDRQQVWLCFIFPVMSDTFSSSLSVCHISDTSTALHGHPRSALWIRQVYSSSTPGLFTRDWVESNIFTRFPKQNIPLRKGQIWESLCYKSNSSILFTHPTFVFLKAKSSSLFFNVFAVQQHIQNL